MLVIALDTSAAAADAVPWSGRRHDDDGPDATAGSTSAELFDVVFDALHDGEQVAVGVDATLTLTPPGGVPIDDDALLQLANGADHDAGRTAVVRLLDELGHWRPWTAVSTSLPGWRATRSILVWQFIDGRPAEAVETFFDIAQTRHDDPQPDPGGAVVNLVAAAALRAGLTVDRADLSRPVLRLELVEAG